MAHLTTPTRSPRAFSQATVSRIVSPPESMTTSTRRRPGRQVLTMWSRRPVRSPMRAIVSSTIVGTRAEGIDRPRA
jgi:hypothetical protein